LQSRRAAIFDLDGTLVDSRAAVVSAVIRGVREAAAAQGVAFAPSERAVVDALGLPALSYFRALLPPQWAALAPAALELATHYEVAALKAGEGRLFDGVLTGLERLRTAGWRIGIVSNAQRAYFHAALESLGLAALCEHAMCQDDLPAAPPMAPSSKQRLLELALNSLDAVAAHSWMLGDRAEDICAGRALGCRTAAAMYGFGSLAEHGDAELRCATFAAFTDSLLGPPRSEP
jgi:phosphoglycolate phosphatase-like HAD superfamily hydrolase